jgi:hypothetical protein
MFITLFLYCITRYYKIGREYRSSFEYYKYEYLNLALPTGGVFLYNI